MSLKTKKCKIFTILDQVDESNSVCSKKLAESVYTKVDVPNKPEGDIISMS